ncbi:MAG: hypothetical protein WCE79_18995 [Xanthobacteraceae bacterium]
MSCVAGFNGGATALLSGGGAATAAEDGCATTGFSAGRGAGSAMSFFAAACADGFSDRGAA